MLENKYQTRARLIREADLLVEKAERLYHEAQDSEATHQIVNKSRKSVRNLLKSADLYLAAGMGLSASYSYGTAASVSQGIGDVDVVESCSASSDAIDVFYEGEDEDEEVTQE